MLKSWSRKFFRRLGGGVPPVVSRSHHLQEDGHTPGPSGAVHFGAHDAGHGLLGVPYGRLRDRRRVQLQVAAPGLRVQPIGDSLHHRGLASCICLEDRHRQLQEGLASTAGVLLRNRSVDGVLLRRPYTSKQPRGQCGLGKKHLQLADHAHVSAGDHSESVSFSPFPGLRTGRHLADGPRVPGFGVQESLHDAREPSGFHWREHRAGVRRTQRGG
mmetsp:Transcript_48521/g.115533  ORF Transcript_48521/g.115533 Transcript_48521/m.115533 type:complete len:215 (+) Transcript_48521:442-1086(+)